MVSTTYPTTINFAHPWSQGKLVSHFKLPFVTHFDTSFVLVHKTLPSIYFCRCFGASFSGKNVLWGWRRGWMEWKGSFFFFVILDLFLQVLI